MKWFSNTIKEIRSSDYETLLKRLAETNADVAKLKAEMESQRSLINSINGRINRKLGSNDEQDLNTGFPFKIGGGT
jgi:hypothetical protein